MAKSKSTPRKSTPQGKMYGHIVKKQLKKLKLDRYDLEERTGLSPDTIKDIESGRNVLNSETRKILSEILKLPILEISPPDIENFSALLEERFAFEIESIKDFIRVHQKVHDQILSIKKLYISNTGNEDKDEDKDLSSKSLADRMLHAKIIFPNPDRFRRETIFLKQISYIGFFELWLPYTEIPYFNKRDNHFLNHIKLFDSCLAGDEKEMENCLEEHLQNSKKDVDEILLFIKKLSHSRGWRKPK